MFAFLKQTISEFVEDNCMQMAAALAYFTVFAMPPLFVILVLFLGMFYQAVGQEGEEAAREQMRQQVTTIAGEAASEPVLEMLKHAGTQSHGWKWALSLVGVLVGATGLVASLQDTLNQTWEVKPDPEQGGIKAFLMKRVFSLGMILGIGFLLLVSTLLTTWINGILGAGKGALGELASLAVVFLVFAAMFKYLPDAEIRWKDVFVGAAVTAVLFSVGKFVLTYYLGNSDFASQFGSAAASLAALLVWVYYSAMILLYGAEFTQVWAKRYGQGIRPEPGAVRVVKETKRVPQGA
jgi:membrane protein